MFFTVDIFRFLGSQIMEFFGLGLSGTIIVITLWLFVGFMGYAIVAGGNRKPTPHPENLSVDVLRPQEDGSAEKASSSIHSRQRSRRTRDTSLSR